MVKIKPVIIVSKAGIPWKRFQNKVRRITIETVDPIPAQTYPTIAYIKSLGEKYGHYPKNCVS